MVSFEGEHIGLGCHHRSADVIALVNLQVDWVEMMFSLKTNHTFTSWNEGVAVSGRCCLRDAFERRLLTAPFIP